MVETKPGLQKHIRCVPGDVAPYVLIPGDPGRVKRIADQMDAAREIANIESTSCTQAPRAASRFSVCSTGIGGPAASIAVEERSTSVRESSSAWARPVGGRTTSRSERR